MSPICPTCGCSLMRLGIDGRAASRRKREGDELLFCCEACAELFDVRAVSMRFTSAPTSLWSGFADEG